MASGSTHVLHLIDGLRVGGAERQLLEAVKALAEAGQKSSVVALSDGPLSRPLAEATSRLFLLERRRRHDLGLTKRIAAVVRTEGIEILHSWDGMSDIYAFLVKILTGVRWIAGSVRTAEGLRSWRECLQRLSWTYADAVLGNSQAGLRAFRCRTGKVIYNGVDFTRFKTDSVAATFPTEQGDFVVGVLANFSHYKDQPTVIRAGHLLHEEGIPARFVFIGDGPTLASCRELAGKGRQPDRFVFLGPQLAPEQFLRLFHVGLVISAATGESCSNALIEFMGAGLPVVATAAGGNSELVDEGINGSLVPVGDDRALAEKLKNLYEDVELRTRMGVEGRRLAHSRFGRDRLGQELIKLYSEVMTS